MTEARKVLDRLTIAPLTAGTIAGVSPTMDISHLFPAMDASRQLDGLLGPLRMQAANPLVEMANTLTASAQASLKPLGMAASQPAAEMAIKIGESLKTSLEPLTAVESAMESSLAPQLKEASMASSSALLVRDMTPKIGETYLNLPDGVGIASGLPEINSWIRSIQPPVIEALKLPEAMILPESLRKQFDKSQHLFEAVDGVAQEWEGNALWFVLSSLNVGDLFLLADLSPEDVEEVIFDALEQVIVEGRFTRSLRVTITEAPHITHSQCENLLHGLQHAEDGEFLHAVPPIMYGLEGAIASAARDKSVIDAERRLLSRPSKKLKSVEAIVKEMQLDEEFRRFLHRRVFGTVGNSFRHGDATEGERRQTLLAIVAISGWVDVFMGKAARAVLVDLMSERLAEAVERLTPQMPQTV